MTRIIIRDSVPQYTRRPLFYMTGPLRLQEYLENAEAAIASGKFLACVFTREEKERQYVAALEADGPDKVEPHYERSMSRDEFGMLFRDLSSTGIEFDVELRMQPQNEPYILEALKSSGARFNLVQSAGPK